jgi:hypothetical protein
MGMGPEDFERNRRHDHVKDLDHNLCVARMESATELVVSVNCLQIQVMKMIGDDLTSNYKSHVELDRAYAAALVLLAKQYERTDIT